MKKALLSAVIISSLSTVAFSSTAAADEVKKKLNPWTDCGIGAMIFKENDVAAVSSNIIWDLGTTAVTSNMSSQHTCEGSAAKTAMFIKATETKLVQDIASGEGEYVNAMLELRGCSSESRDNIVKAIRQDYAAKPSQNAEQLFNAVEKRVSTSFSESCASA
jgi:hypothetical protein